jgi:hypothetical protein
MVSTQIITLNSHCPFTIKGSIFGPNVMYTLSCTASKGGVAPLPAFAQSSHLIGPMLRGILGGKIMQHVLPDNK